MPDLDTLLRAMQEPSAYPHAVEQVTVVQTHVSCVFLTGSYVYKIKKPVTFPFLDYGTLERRREYCEEEVRLNRRLCPDVYLDVVPLTWQEGRLHVDGSGCPIEWAVRMRQLRSDAMLPVRLQNGTANCSVIEALARRLADFHEHAARNQAIRSFGDRSRIRETIAFTLQTMENVASESVPTPTRQALRRYLEAWLEEAAALLQQRQQQDRIRDCHGDLRAQNICLDPRFDHGIQIFDCIEFNNALRYIDVVADLAYLTMDLDLAGRADLRACLLDTYAAATGDRDLRALLPFYQTYRAIVRGNIALLAAAENEVALTEREAHRQKARTAYDLAASYAAQRKQPALVIMVGYSGSGKSVLARELSCRLPAILLSSDRIRKEQRETKPSSPLEPAHYTATQRANIYAELRRRAAVWLSRHEHVVLDATFLNPEERQRAAVLARNAGAEFWIVECHLPEPLLRQRLAARHADPNASDADASIYLHQRETYPVKAGSLITEQEALLTKATGHVLADTGQSPDETARAVVERFCAL